MKHNLKNYLKNSLQSLILGANYPRVSTWPYISGDAFMSLCDFTVSQSLKHLAPSLKRNVARKQIYFCECQNLAFLWPIIQDLHNQVLIIHNGDTELTARSRQIIASYSITLYATNLQAPKQGETCIPIGIENAHLNRNGSPTYYSLDRSIGNDEKSTLFFASFRDTHASRIELQSLLKHHNLRNMALTPIQHRHALKSSLFAFSPRGNGLDCHRFWEAIYEGAIPIVLKTDYLFHNLSLPVLSIDSWDDVFQYSQDELSNLYHSIWANSDCDPAMMTYWANHILQAAQYS